ncbi:hypothetical protein DCAR_0417073 [Daucus carota subsp. sativus]|uniref:Uncharacterized protein n=1 Tax=Daucus carota subsp. sativus TaxID=79200 RepID=A0AAF0WX51_DAUCS|nr:hypothetical protein DCAR_0417073 [Daucus carota subsp. sativus]
MEACTATTKKMNHSRSISLPSRPHPSVEVVEEQLCRVRSSNAASTSSFCNKLTGLNELFECLDDLLQSQTMQSSDSEDVLRASIRLLELCNSTKDAFSLMRSSVQNLESSLRRREADVSSKVGNYLICVKKVNKMVSKSFTNFKKSHDKNRDSPAILSLLKQVEEVSITVFESLFSSVFPATSKQNKWSMVFKSTQSKHLHKDNNNQVDKIQLNLEALYQQKRNSQSDLLRIQETQKCLMGLDMNMQQVEEDLNSLYRSLIKTRVSILNSIL